MKFNSQICTTREQSERLLALGLKKETADMTIHIKNDGDWYVTAEPFYEWEDDINTLPILEEAEQLLPAWSLHRLLMMTTNKRKVMLIRCESDLYDVVIKKIEREIKESNFNKEYLV